MQVILTGTVKDFSETSIAVGVVQFAFDLQPPAPHEKERLLIVFRGPPVTVPFHEGDEVEVVGVLLNCFESQAASDSKIVAAKITNLSRQISWHRPLLKGERAQ